ncbi:MAG: T9SS type A sorting domain-containing protein [Bacteroidales bacterium]|nr:T9SS type A sorting domain-containing protein [Bacteroidales bacterium]
MKKISLMILLLSVVGFSISAQSISRLKSWGYLDSPPAPFKTFSTTDASYMLLASGKLVKVEVDGSLTEMCTILCKTYSKASDVAVKVYGNMAMFSLVEGSNVYYYVTSGTASSSKLVHQLTKTLVNPPSFAYMNGKAYILTTDLTEISLADNSKKVLKTVGTVYKDYFKTETDGQNLYITYNIDDNSTKLALSKVDLATGDLSVISDRVDYWNPIAPIIPLNNGLLYWSLKDTTMVVNGSKSSYQRTLLTKYDAQTNSSQQVFEAGVGVKAPDYLGEVDGKLYFFSNGDYSLSYSCSTCTFSGATGAYLWEGSSQGFRLVKGIENGTEKYTYAGIKQVASDKIYLELTTKTEGKETWVASATDLFLLKDFNPGASSLKDYGLKLVDGVTCGGKLAVPGIGVVTSPSDNELYLSDGTPNNFYKFDVMPKADLQSMPRGLINVNNKIYFIAADSILGLYNLPMTSLFALDLCADISQGVNDVLQTRYLKIYPNPAAHFIQLKSDNPIDQVEIISVSGALIYRSYSGEKTIDVNSLKRGVYLVKAYHNKGVDIARFVKE